MLDCQIADAIAVKSHRDDLARAALVHRRRALDTKATLQPEDKKPA
jgi:hypothetical protein